jgi:hypothetical protein
MAKVRRKATKKKTTKKPVKTRNKHKKTAEPTRVFRNDQVKSTEDILKTTLSTDPKVIDPKGVLKDVLSVFRENPYIKGLSVKDTGRAKALYLQKYLETGRNDVSARAAGIQPQTFYLWKQNDPEFKEAFELAKEIALQSFEDAAVRRGVHGVLKPIYQQGNLVGHERRYSDSMLSMILKGGLPEKYRERIGIGGDESAPPVKFQGLSPEQANALRAEVLGVSKKQKKGG